VERGAALEGTPVCIKAPSSCEVFQQFRGPCKLLCTREIRAPIGVESGGRFSCSTDRRPASGAHKRVPGVSTFPSGALPP
ncbi:hypothetical protein Cfor_10997, partial [Coptotermes formosanus]